MSVMLSCQAQQEAEPMPAIPDSVHASLGATSATSVTSATPATASASHEARPCGHIRFHSIRKLTYLPIDFAIALELQSQVVLSSNEQRLLVSSTARTSVVVLDAQSLEVLDHIPTDDAVGNLRAVDEQRFVVGWAGFGRRSSRRGGYLPADELFIFDGTDLRLLHRLTVGANIGTVADLGNGLLLVAATGGAVLALVDLPTGEVLSRHSTKDSDFSPGHVVLRSDGLIGAVSGGIFQQRISREVTGLGRSRAIGTQVLLFDPHAPANHSRMTFFPKLQHPRGMLFHRDGRHVFVADAEANALVILDWVDRRTKELLPVAASPQQLGFFPGQQRIWLRHSEAQVLTVVDTETGTIDELRLPDMTLTDPLFSPDAQIFYLATLRPAEIVVVDAASLRILDRIEVPMVGQGLAVSRDGCTLFATLGVGTYVVRID